MSPQALTETAQLIRPLARHLPGREQADDDSALARAAQAGRPEAVEALIRRHWDSAHRAAYLVLCDPTAAEDAAQEAMLQAVRDIDRYDARRPFAPWLHRIVINRSLDLLRRRDRRPESALEESELTALVAQPDERAAGPATAALAQLQPDDRAAVVLRYVFGYSAREIGRMLDMPHATVRTRLRRSLVRIRAVLEPQGGDAR